MSTSNIKRRNYRKKREDTPEDSTTETTAAESSTASQDGEPEGLSLDELLELRKYRQRPAGVAAVDLLVGDTSGKKKKKDKIIATDPWKLLSGGGLVDMDEVRRKEDGESTESGMMSTFTKQTNVLNVDKHMMKYIDDEMKKRRGEADVVEDTNDKSGDYNPDIDILDELGIKKAAPKPEQEGNVQLSTTMLTAIPEVDLGMEAKLRNIEETERAKRKLFEERITTNHTANERFSQPAYIPSDSERMSHQRQNGRNNNDNSSGRNSNYNVNNSSSGVPNHRFHSYGGNSHQGNRGGVGRGMATDDLVMERFKKRTRR
ncbi:hypothetical protein FBU30_001127 [Linnemannia zychae]|nr:hypothetical protein FBU30_001127 [Linnemannia zychae]